MYDVELNFFGVPFRSAAAGMLSDCVYKAVYSAFRQWYDTVLITEAHLCDDIRRMDRGLEDVARMYKRQAANWGRRMSLSFVMEQGSSRKYVPEYADVGRLRADGYHLAGLRWSRGSRRESVHAFARDGQMYWMLEIDRPKLYVLSLGHTWSELKRNLIGSLTEKLLDQLAAGHTVCTTF